MYNQVILPINKNIISYDPLTDIVQCIIDIDDNNNAYIYVENYIDTICYLDQSRYSNNVAFYKCLYPYLSCFDYYSIEGALSHLLITDVVDKIIDMLNNGYYTTICVDTYYISTYIHTYKKEHFEHELFIYGYDKAGRTFYVSDFFGHSQRENLKVSFAEIEDSFYKSILTYNNSENYGYTYYFNYIGFIKQDFSLNRTINLTRCINRLANFISEHHVLPFNDIALGISFFDVLVDRVLTNRLSVKHISFVKVHIEFMIKRLQLITSNLHVDFEYEIEMLTLLLADITIAVNLTIKNSFTYSDNNCSKICHSLKNAKERYCYIIDAVISNLAKS